MGLSKVALVAVDSLCSMRVLQTFQSFTVKGNLLLKGDKVNDVQHHMGGGSKGWLCRGLSFFPILYSSLACPATHTLLLAGLTLPRVYLAQRGLPGPSSPCCTWIIFLDYLLDHFLLKKPVSPPNESHNHSCDPAAGSECTAPHGTAAMPGSRAMLGGRQEDGWSSQGHLTSER